MSETLANTLRAFSHYQTVRTIWDPNGEVRLSDVCDRAARVIEYLEDPQVLLTIPQPHRLRLSELLHGKDNAL